MPEGVAWTRAQLEALPGLCLHDLMLLPLDRLRRFFESMTQVPNVVANEGETQALKLLFEEITTRLKYLCDVGIGYLTLDRQSRTLSGGEVQRINLTTALGTSLVNTLFVLDEPSIGLHPRDMHRIIKAMQRLRDAGNTLVVVEHDPAVMLAADRMIDMGPGPGERGGQIVFDGTTEALRSADTLTGAYLGGRKQVGHGIQAHGDRPHAAPHPGGRARAQPAERDRRDPAAAPGLRHGRQRLRQVQPDPGRAGPGPDAPLRQGHGNTGHTTACWARTT
jgi:excinuclease ABC subunit A